MQHYKSILFLLSFNVFADPVGAINLNVTQENIQRTICVKNWTKTIRPPVSYTQALKSYQIKEGENPADFEEDHFISLEIGGAPRDANNLWPEPWPDARKKDKLENQLHKLVCTNKITLLEAQERIKHYRDYIK